MANGLNEADYTAESFAVMKSALASAQAVYENEQAAEAEVKEAEADLRSAVDALVKSDIFEETPEQMTQERIRVAAAAQEVHLVKQAETGKRTAHRRQVTMYRQQGSWLSWLPQ